MCVAECGWYENKHISPARWAYPFNLKWNYCRWALWCGGAWRGVVDCEALKDAERPQHDRFFSGGRAEALKDAERMV